MYSSNPFLQILMTEISTHDTYEISDLLDLDYPPHIEIAVKRVE